jgi:hypothetical protein
MSDLPPQIAWKLTTINQAVADVLQPAPGVSAAAAQQAQYWWVLYSVEA